MLFTLQILLLHKSIIHHINIFPDFLPAFLCHGRIRNHRRSLNNAQRLLDLLNLLCLLGAFDLVRLCGNDDRIKPIMGAPLIHLQIVLIRLVADIRHKPNQNDLQMYEWCTHYGFNPIIIATKADKIKRSQKAKQIKQIKETLGVVEGTPVIPYSSMTKEGREEIWEYIDMVYDGFMQEQDLQSE